MARVCDVNLAPEPRVANRAVHQGVRRIDVLHPEIGRVVGPSQIRSQTSMPWYGGSRSLALSGNLCCCPNTHRLARRSTHSGVYPATAPILHLRQPWPYAVWFAVHP